MQAIIIQYPVIDSLGCSTLAVNFLVGIRSARHICIKPDVPFWPGLYDTTIFGRRTVMCTFGGMVFPIRTSPHKASSGFVITVREHTLSSGTDRNPILVDCNVIVDGPGMATFIIEVNKSPYFSVFE